MSAHLQMIHIDPSTTKATTNEKIKIQLQCQLCRSRQVKVKSSNCVLIADKALSWEAEREKTLFAMIVFTSRNELLNENGEETVKTRPEWVGSR
jgi:hypothetical protein